MAFGTGTINSIGGAVGDIFGGEATADKLGLEATAARLRAHGSRIEAENYDLASTLAKQNEQFTEQSTAIKQTQAQRQLYLGLGTTSADVAGAGFSMSGSALDLMRSSAQQGALTKQVLGAQGLITEAGYKEQQTAYSNMAEGARYAAGVEDEMASKMDQMGKSAISNSYITGGFKAASAIASFFI